MGIPNLRENDRFSNYRKSILCHVEKALIGFEHAVFVTSPASLSGIPGIVDRTNMLIEKVLSGGFDYLWIVQADVEVPEVSFKNLLALNVDVAFGVVPRHDEKNSFICGFMDEEKKIWYLPRQVIQNQVLSGWVFASGCVLVKRQVFEEGIRFRYEVGIGEDILFAYDVQRAGFVAKVDGRVVCGHLPEWPLLTTGLGVEEADSRGVGGVLDVGCGHRPQGDVNVDLFPQPTLHRTADQRINDDAPLHVHEIPNFVRADACHLPFRDRAFRQVFAWHVIEHVSNPEEFLGELLRVSAEKVEVRCPNGDHPSAFGDSKPLHLQRLTLNWFDVKIRQFSGWKFMTRLEYSQGEPWEIVLEGIRESD